MPFSSSMGSLVENYLHDGWMHRDARRRGLGVMMQRGAFSDLDFTDSEEIGRHPFYQEFLAAHGCQWFGGVKIAFGEELWCVAIQRSPEQGPFSPAAMDQLSELSLTLGSAGALACALDFARADAALAAFEISGSAVVMLNRSAEITRFNGAFERLLGDDLKIVRRRVVSSNHATTAALDRALHQLLWTRTASALMPPVVLPRRNKRPVLAYPMRLARITDAPLGECQALLVMVDLDRHGLPPDAVLRATFGLTAAEARLAQTLASGESLQKAAEIGCITKATARSHLKAIFAKTQTHRQSELVSVMARIRQ